MSGNYVINIGRQLGSGGKEIGEKLAARLGINFYDKELINLASEESGLCKEFFEKADEKASQGIIGGLFGMRFPFISEGAMPCNNCLSNDALFKVQSDVIRHLAAERSCVFVGRCADYILREHEMNIWFFFRNDNLFFIRAVHHENKPGFRSFGWYIVYRFLYTGIDSFSVKADHRIKYASFRLRTFSDCELDIDTIEYIPLVVNDRTFRKTEMTRLVVI